LQEFTHWIFLFHCKLLTSSANLRVTIISVRSQPCFNVGQKGVVTPFLHHYTPGRARQLDQMCRPWWRLQLTQSHFQADIWPILSKWVPHL